MVANDYTHKEFISNYIAQRLQDYDHIFVGANLPVPRTGALLAHFTHAPNMKVSIGLVRANLLNERELEPHKFSTDYRMQRWAEAITVHDNVFEKIRDTITVFFIGGIQVDKFGNTNLIGIGKDYKHLDFRGPGTLGTLSCSYYCDRYYIFVESHSRRLFVDKCDFISVFGHGEGGDHRQRLGLARYNAGPECVITPLCIMDFEPETKRARLKSVHPWSSVDEVVENTGFKLIIPEQVPVTEGPTNEALETIRSRIDLEGLLQ